MNTVKPRTVYALLLTFEEKGKLSQQVNLFSLKENASSLKRAFVPAINQDENSRLLAETLKKLEVVPVLCDEGFRLAAYTVALTWEGETGVEQSIELFEGSDEAKAARERHERAFADGSRMGRLIALSCEKTPITAPISEGDATFRSYQDAVDQLKRR